MYRRILVPLDGSKLAETALPHVENIAQGCGTEEVILISVTERIPGRVSIEWPREAWPLSKQEIPRTAAVPTGPAGIYSRIDPVPLPERVKALPVAVGKKLVQAEKYLGRIAKRLEKKGIVVRTGVLLGSPAEEIVSIIDEVEADLVLMATHGRSGVGRWAYGSVAEKVLRASSVPVLVVRPTASKSG